MSAAPGFNVADIGFWAAADAFIARNTIEIDRPRGSVHPRQSHIVYPLDYGHLVGTSGGDGEWSDVWLGTSELQVVVACVATVDLFQGDTEVKLLYRCVPAEVNAVAEFYRRHDLGALMIRRY